MAPALYYRQRFFALAILPSHVPLLFLGGLIRESNAEAATYAYGAAESQFFGVASI
jgi:hypothetical protein